MAYISYGFAHLLTLIVIAAISVYGFGYFEPRWGQAVSMQVLCYVGLLAAVIGSIVFGFVGSMRGKTCGARVAMVCGLLTALTSSLVLEVLNRWDMPLNIFQSAVLWVLLAATATIFLKSGGHTS